MKLPKVIALVLTMHVAVIGVLLLSPGCKTTGGSTSSSSAIADTSTSETSEPSEADYRHDSTLDPAFNAGFAGDPDALPADQEAPRIIKSDSTANRPRLPPTRPESNLSGSGATLNRPADTMSGAAAPVTLKEISDPKQVDSFKPQEPGMQYTVKSGDSLWKISRQFNVTLDTLLSANNMTRNSMIRPGQTLEIPGVSGAAVSSGRSPGTSIASSSVSARQSVGGMTYTVLPGDTLSEIAKVHGVSVEALRSVNGISGNRILAGQDLILPEGANMPELRVKEKAPGSRVSAVPAREAREGLTHKVASGDTLSGIAKKYGVTVKQIQDLNGISDPRRLSVGKVLIISSPAERNTKPSSSTSTRPSAVLDEINESMFEDDAPPVTELRRLED